MGFDEMERMLFKQKKILKGYSLKIMDKVTSSNHYYGREHCKARFAGGVTLKFVPLVILEEKNL